MFHCHVCGGNEAHTEFVSEVFVIDGKHLLVEKIPALICDKCGEQTFSRETTERVRQMVQDEAQPVGTMEMDVFSYSV